jgi:uncharacterized membrane protein YfcA
MTNCRLILVRRRNHCLINTMNIIPAIGATCLGIVIGWLVRYFIRRFDKFGPMVLGSLVSIVFGGAAIKFLEADKTVWWFYPIGLLLGFVIYHVVAARQLANRPGGPNAKPPKPPEKDDPISFM